MKLLVLAPQLPYPPHKGTSIRNYSLARSLAVRHQVYLLTFCDDPDVPVPAELSSRCEVQLVRAPHRKRLARVADLCLPGRPDLAGRLRSAEYVRCLESVLESRRPDIVLIEGLEMCVHWDALASRGDCPKAVLDQHNAEYVLQRRAFEIDLTSPSRWRGAAYSLLQSWKLARYERKMCRRMAAVVAASEADRAALLTLDRGLRIAVVPNGVDTTQYTVDDRRAGGEKCLIFVGTMDFRPNVDAMLWFCEAVWPRILAVVPDASFWIVGGNPKPEVQRLASQTGVHVTGSVPDVRPYLASARLAVVPLRVGGGSRLKVLEAMAAGVPVVSTTLGCEGIDLTPDSVALADSAEDFARVSCDLLASDRRCRALATAGRRLVEEKHDWRAIVPRLELFLEQVRCG